MPVNRRELLHTAIAGSVGVALIGLQRACLADADFEAVIRHPFMSKSQRAAIATVAELIIPETDTPGSIAAAVPQFLELLLSDWYSAEERQPLIAGIEELEIHCMERWQRSFSDCEPQQQADLLSKMQDSEFFKMIKSLTVYGYYSSEVGATAELKFSPAPGRYTTVDFADVGRQWVK